MERKKARNFHWQRFFPENSSMAKKKTVNEKNAAAPMCWAYKHRNSLKKKSMIQMDKK